MRKLVFSVLILPILLLSYELDFNKNFSRTVHPDLLSTNITVMVEKSDENSVNKQIEKFNIFIKDVKYVTIKNGNYSLSPRYDYNSYSSSKGKTQEFVGFTGYLRYTVQSDNAQDINKFVSELLKVKDEAKSPDVKLDISAILWEVSPTLQDKVHDGLRVEAITWIENYSNILSSQFSKKCEVKTINMDSYIQAVMPRINTMAMAKVESVSDVAPMSNEQNIFINPKFLLECK